MVSEELYRRRLDRHPQRDRRRIDPGSGTDEQKRWLPAASGEVLPTAVFTSPIPAPTRLAAPRPATATSTGSPATRPDPSGGLDDALVRTDPKQPGYRGLSMLLAEKPRGSDDPFPRPACPAPKSGCSAIAA